MNNTATDEIKELVKLIESAHIGNAHVKKIEIYYEQVGASTFSPYGSGFIKPRIIIEYE